MQVAEVLWFLRVQHAAPARQPLRLAVYELFAAQPMQDGMQVAKQRGAAASRLPTTLWMSACWAAHWSQLRLQAACHTTTSRGCTEPGCPFAHITECIRLALLKLLCDFYKWKQHKSRRLAMCLRLCWRGSYSRTVLKHKHAASLGQQR